MILTEMRFVYAALVILACGFRLPADEVLQNSDFSDGISHWHGDGKTPSDFTEDNSVAATDSLTSKGLIVPLKPDGWTNVSQEFNGDKYSHYLVTVTYKVSPDLTLSNKAEDYKNVAKLIRFENYERYPSFDVPVGQFFVMISEVDGNKGYWEKFPPKLGSSDTQTYLDPGQPLDPQGRKMVTLAFPPGTGMVVILSISVTSS